MAAVNPIPDGYPRLIPYLHVDGAADAIDFYVRVLGATEPGDRLVGPDGRVGHSELRIGDSMIMCADEYPDMGIVGPKAVGGTPVTLHVYVEDVDATVEEAVRAGAKILRPVEDQFYGDRLGTFEDPFGHHWSIATHTKDVDPAEMAKLAAAEMAEQTEG